MVINNHWLLNVGLEDLLEGMGEIKKVNYNELYKDAQVLVFGDTNHTNSGIMGNFAEELEDLRYSGVKYLAIELPDNYQKGIDKFNRTGGLEYVQNLLESTKNPVRMKQLFLEAYKNNIEIVAIDMPEEKQEKFDKEKRDIERGIYMGKKISELARNNEKIVAYVGAAHLEKNQIPSQLKGIKLRKIAMYTENQLDLRNPTFDSPHIGIAFGQYAPPSQAMEMKGIKEKVYVELDGNKFGFDGFIYFPRKSLIKKKIIATNNFKSIPENQGLVVYPESLQEIFKKELSSQFIEINFENYVEPDVRNWEETNKEKIFYAISNFEGLSDTQKLFLAVMLENYVRRSTRHGGGSIVRIEFDPELQAFGIDTVDTFGYEYVKGTPTFHREVTISTLLSYFGKELDEILVKDVKEIPKTEIKPADNFESMYKFVLFLSTKATHPEYIKIKQDADDEYKIFITKNGIYDAITKLDVTDFKLNNLERKLLNLLDLDTEESYEIYRFIPDVLSVLDESKRKPRYIKDLEKKLYNKINDDLQHKDMYRRRKEGKRLIENYLCNLKHVDKSALEEFANEMINYFNSNIKFVRELKSELKNHPKLYEKVKNYHPNYPFELKCSNCIDNVLRIYNKEIKEWEKFKREIIDYEDKNVVYPRLEIKEKY